MVNVFFAINSVCRRSSLQALGIAEHVEQIHKNNINHDIEQLITELSKRPIGTLKMTFGHIH